LAENLGENFILAQDNARAHIAAPVRRFIDRHYI